MQSLRFLPLFALLAGSAAAQNVQDLPIEGADKPGPGDTAAAQSFFAEAGRIPNATSSFGGYAPSQNKSQAFTWTVNITDVAIPNRLADVGLPSANSSQGFHVINTQWAIDWPRENSSDNGTLQSFLGANNLTMKVAIVRTPIYSNLTSAYVKGDCSRVLGAQCQESMTLAFRTKGQNFLTYPGLAGCGQTLDTLHVNSAILEYSSNSTNTAPMERGDTLYFWTSPASVGVNQTAYREAEAEFQMLIVEYFSTNTQQRSQYVLDSGILFCQIVDAASVPAPSATSGRVGLGGTAGLLGVLAASIVVLMSFQ